MERIVREINNISSKIQEAKGSVSDMASDKISKKFISDANMELDAVVKATEEATHKILDAAEEIQKLISSSGDNKEKIIAKITEIFEACNFQDITGQRIRKVVRTLFDIEKSVDLLKSMVGSDSSSGSLSSSAPPASVADKEKHLLNGPQLNQPNQQDIDKMFKDVEKKN